MNNNNDKNKYGVCPLMSNALAAQGVSTGPGNLVKPTPSIVSMVASAPCCGPICQWWDAGGERCCIREFADTFVKAIIGSETRSDLQDAVNLNLTTPDKSS